jgi:periplasmic divalent cation tolerance protein
MEEIVLVLTTVPEDFDASALAEALVKERHAACVSVLPTQASTYRWQGEIAIGREHQVVIKTTLDRVDALREAIRRRHPYELPEFLVVPVTGGDPAYLDWVRKSLL